MSSEISNADYNNMDAPQELESAGTFGGHCAVLCFFAFFEGFTCVWLLIAISMFLSTLSSGSAGIGFVFTFPAFGFFFHYVTQSMLSRADPGRVRETLRSLEECMEDEECAKVLDELRGVAPKVTVHAEAYHETSSGTGENQRTSTHIDAVEEEDLHYAAWKDNSGRVAGLENYKIVAIEVVPVITYTDESTNHVLSNLHQRLKDACYARAPNSTRSKEVVVLEHPIYPVTDAKVFVTRSPGAGSASWMTVAFYDRCRFAFPFLGTIYRILFLTSMANVRFKLFKELSVIDQYGVGWSKH